MNLKVLAAAVSVLAICAEARIIGSDDGDLPQVDEFDKDLGLELQALSARLGDKLPAQQSLALNPLQLLLDVLDRVDTALLAATSALNDTVTTATQAAEYATQGAVDRWNQALQDAINRTDAVAVQQCVAEHSSLPTLARALEQDAVRCVTDATSSIRGISAELQQLRERTQSLIDQLRKRPLQILDLSLILNPYTRSLVVDATVLALQLVVDNLQSSAACVGNVINARSAEANASINAVRQCIDASLNSTTAAPTA